MVNKKNIKLNPYLKQASEILNDPLHELVSRQKFIPQSIQVDTIQIATEPLKKSCKLCKCNFKQKKINAYQVVTLDEYYPLKKNTHYVCKKCIEEHRIETK